MASTGDESADMGAIVAGPDTGIVGARDLTGRTVAVYFTTTQYAREEPETYEAFVTAMDESLTFAEENPDAAREILGTYTEISPEVIDAMTMPRFPATLDVESLEVMADLSQQYGLVSEDFTVEEVLPD